VKENIFQKYQNIIRNNEINYVGDHAEITEKLHNSNAKYKGKIIDILYQPMFFNETDIKRFEYISETMSAIIGKCTDEYLNNPSFRKYFGYSEIMEDLILIDPGYNNPVPIARFDLFYSDNFKFCELNGDGTSAMNEANTLEKIFMESSIIKKLVESYDISYNELFVSWLNELLKLYREFGGTGKPNIAITDFLGLGSNEEFDTFKEIFEQQGFKTVICDPREFKYHKGELYFNDIKIDLVYRRAVNKEVESRISEVSDLIMAYREKAVCVVGPFRSQIMHNKIFFEILWNEEAIGFLNEKERKFIKEHVPKTFSLNHENLFRATDFKDNYVIKPKDYYAGKGVVCGLDCSEEEWIAELNNALESGNCIIQEFSNFTSIKLPVITAGKIEFMNFKTTLGVFVYNGKLQGLYSRVGRENVIAGIKESITLPSLLYKRKEKE
jgi:glutathionylspermidine synthase